MTSNTSRPCYFVRVVEQHELNCGHRTARPALIVSNSEPVELTLHADRRD